MSRVSRVVAALLAVVLPLAIVAGAVAELERYRAFDDAREARNAGKVINGRVVEGSVVQHIERKLSEHRPEVVILGNSLSNTDIKPILLAARLGLPRDKVQRFSIPHSVGVHWYAILKNRVYANGHRPRLVIVLADLQSTLAVHPPSEASQQNLRVQLGGFDPVIAHKMGDRPNYVLERIRENRTHVRDRLLKSARNRMVDLLVHHSIEPTPRRRTEASLNRVFHASKTDMRLHGDVIPTFGTTEMTVAFDPESLPVPGRSFLPEITELVAAHDGHAVFLRPPMSPLLPPDVGDIVPEASERKARRLVEKRGGVYLDLRGLGVDDGHFHNVDHMNPEGAQRLTEVTVTALAERGLWRNHEVPVLDLLRPIGFDKGVLVQRHPTVEPRGRPPAVPRSVRPMDKGRRGVVYMKSDALTTLADGPLVDATPYASRCSPVRVLEDGAALPMHNVSCEQVARHRGGRVCHNPEKIFFTPPDSSDPLINGRHYELALDPDRFCDGSIWLYPGDHVRVGVEAADLQAMPDPAGRLQVSAEVFGEGRGGRFQAELRGPEGVLARVDEEVEDLPARMMAGVEPLLEPSDTDVWLHLRNDSKRFVLVTRVQLLDDEPPAGG